MDAQKYIQILGSAIREKREQLGYSQESFAAEVGLNRTYIGQVERGEKNITIKNLLNIAIALGTTPYKILILVDKQVSF